MDDPSRRFKKILKKLKNPTSIIVGKRIAELISDMSEFNHEKEYDMIGKIFGTKVYLYDDVRSNIIIVKSDMQEYDLELDLGIEIEDLI